MPQERHRQRIGPAGAGPGSDLFDDPGAGTGSATVTHGPFAEVLPVAEMTISQVRSRFQDRLDIHPEAMAMLGGPRTSVPFFVPEPVSPVGEVSCGSWLQPAPRTSTVKTVNRVIIRKIMFRSSKLTPNSGIPHIIPSMRGVPQ